MHIYISKLTIISSDNGLLPPQCQAIIWTIFEILWSGPLRTNFSEILIEKDLYNKFLGKRPVAPFKWRNQCFFHERYSGRLFGVYSQVEGSVQRRRTSSASAMEVCLFCIKFLLLYNMQTQQSVSVYSSHLSLRKSQHASLTTCRCKKEAPTIRAWTFWLDRRMRPL